MAHGSQSSAEVGALSAPFLPLGVQGLWLGGPSSPAAFVTGEDSILGMQA